MAIALTAIGTANAKSVNSLTITVPVGGVPAGSLIVVSGAEGSTGGTGSCTDSKGNTYLNSAGGTAIFTSTNGFCNVFYAYNCTALVAGDTITFTFQQTGVTGAATAYYATGIQTSADPGYVQQGASGSSATPSGISGSNINAGDLVHAVVATRGPAGDTFTQDSTNGAYATPPTRVGTTGGAQGANWTIAGGSLVAGATQRWTYAPLLGTSRSWADVVIGFKAAVTGPTTYNDTITEAGAAADSFPNAMTMPNTLTESGAAADSMVGGLLFTSTVTEAGSAADSLAAAATFAPSIAEAGAATGSLAVLATFAASLTETGSATDSMVGGLLLSSTIAEAGSAADSFAAGMLFTNTLTETGAAADSVAAQATFAATLSENGAAADTFAAATVIAQAFTEAGAAADGYTTLMTFGATLLESGLSADSYAVVLQAAADYAETGNATDTYSTGEVVAAVNDWLVSQARRRGRR